MPEPAPQGDRPQHRRLSRRLRFGIGAALAALAAFFVLHFVLHSGDEFRYDGPDAPQFSFSYKDLTRKAPRAGELVRLESGPDGGFVRLTAEPLEFSASAEPVGGSLPLAAGRFATEAGRSLPRFRLLEEGRTRLEILHGIEAYQLGYTAEDREGEGILIGKTYLIPEQTDRARRGVVLTLLQRTDNRKIRDAVREAPGGFFLNWPIRFWLQLATAVDEDTPLERPVKSFAFG